MILVFFIGGILSGLSIQYFPFLTLSGCSVFLLVFIRKKAFIKFLLFLAGFFYSFSVSHKSGINIPAEEMNVRVVFSSCSKESDLEQYTCRIFFKGDRSGFEPEKARIYLDQKIPPGTEAEITMKLKIKQRGLVPGFYGEPYYIVIPSRITVTGKAHGIRWMFENQREKLYEFFKRVFHRDKYEFANSLITGHREIDPSIREAFKKTGLFHLLTISGTHFGLLFFLAFNFFKRLILLLPYRPFHKLTTYISMNFIAGFLTILFLFWYLVISGMEIPAVRSFIMSVLFVIGLIIGKRYSWLAGVLVAATIILLVDPLALFDPSFILSFLAVVFIGLWFERFKKEKSIRRDNTKGLKEKISDFLNDSFFISAAATIGTAPFVMYFFHYISLVGLFTNLFITPFVCFIILPMLLIMSVFYLFTGLCILRDPAEGLINFVLRIIETAASFKYADVPIPSFPVIFILIFYVFILLFLFGNRLGRYIGAGGFVALVLFIFLRIDRSVHIIFIDVNQGDSSVVELPEGKTIVIDTGRDGIETSAYLRYTGRRSVDAVVLTHPHPDHSGGLKTILDNFDVKEIWDNGLLIYPDEVAGVKRRPLSRGDLIKIKDDYLFLILHPYPGFYTRSGTFYNSENNSSLVIKFVYRNISALFTGDIELEAEEDLAHLGNIIDSDILKVPHHGSHYSAHKAFFNKVSPRLAIISAGKENPYRHPHKEVLTLLKDSRQFITARDGTVKLVITKTGNIRVKIYKEYTLSPAGGFRDELRNMVNLIRTF